MRIRAPSEILPGFQVLQEIDGISRRWKVGDNNNPGTGHPRQNRIVLYITVILGENNNPAQYDSVLPRMFTTLNCS